MWIAKPKDLHKNTGKGWKKKKNLLCTLLWREDGCWGGSGSGYWFIYSWTAAFKREKRGSVYSWLVCGPASTELKCWYISDNTQRPVYSSTIIIQLQVLYRKTNYYYRSQFSLTAGGCRIKYPSFILIQSCLHVPVCEHRRRAVTSKITLESWLVKKSIQIPVEQN